MVVVSAAESEQAVELFGARVDAITMTETLDAAFALAADPTPSQHVVLNASKVVQMQDDSKLRKIVGDCDLVNADGTSVVWASRILGRPLPERVTGIDLFQRIVERAASSGHRVYFLGATDEVLGAMVKRFRTEFPTIQIAGYRNGYWNESEAPEIVAAIRDAAPDFLFLAIPSPRKEYWLAENLHELSVPFVMGVGGSFDVLAGFVKRAPRWMQRIGCEWVYRLVQEPRRMWKRYLVGNARFALITWRARFAK